MSVLCGVAWCLVLFSARLALLQVAPNVMKLPARHVGPGATRAAQLLSCTWRGLRAVSVAKSIQSEEQMLKCLIVRESTRMISENLSKV